MYSAEKGTEKERTFAPSLLPHPPKIVGTGAKKGRKSRPSPLSFAQTVPPPLPLSWQSDYLSPCVCICDLFCTYSIRSWPGIRQYSPSKSGVLLMLYSHFFAPLRLSGTLASPPDCIAWALLGGGGGAAVCLKVRYCSSV